MPDHKENPKAGSDDVESLLADIEFLTARIQMLQNHHSAYDSLREARQRLDATRKLLLEKLRDADTG